MLRLRLRLVASTVLAPARSIDNTAKEVINILKRQLLGLGEEEIDARESDTGVEGDEDEIVLPTKLAETLRGNLGPHDRDSPVTDTSSEGDTSTTDLVRHDLRHVSPGDGTEGKREEDGDKVNPQDAGSGETLTISGNVLRVADTLEQQTTGDSGTAEQERPASSNAVDQQGDKEDIGDRANHVEEASHQGDSITLDTEVPVHDSLVVIDDVGTGGLGEHLERCSDEKSFAPLRDSEHSGPARDLNLLLCGNGVFDFSELLVNPLLVGAIVV